MSIRVTRNETGNCINFVGSTQPAYWNACLSAQVNPSNTDNIDIVNDIISNVQANTVYEFFNVPFTEFADKDGNQFADAQEAVDYINQNANVTGLSEVVGKEMTGVDINFQLDATSTTVLLDNGFAYAVNSIKAVADTDGTVHINAISTGTPEDGTETDRKHLEKVEVGRVYVDGTLVAGGLQDVVNTLNELFTVGPFQAVVISDPYSTMVADVAGVDAGYTLEGADAVDPVGDDIFTYDGAGYANYAGLKSTATIDQPGEYYTFDIRGEGTIGFGLVHTDASFAAGKASGNQNYADPDNFAAVNSAHYGMQFSHWFHPTPNGSWTNYGASTGYVGGPGWSNNWDQQQDWLDGNPVKIKCGIDENGYIAISSLQDDGSWILHARSSYPVADGSDFHLGIKSQSTSARVYTAPKAHLLEEEAPTMYFRYIESPDGNFEYPLFATEEEANYYDTENGGTGTSHTHTYADDPTNTTWYMPDTNGEMAGTSAPAADTTLGVTATYTEITSLTDADLTPSAFVGSDFTYEEGTVVNIQLMPAGAAFTQSVSISPANSGMVYNSVSGYLQGTLTDVGADTTYTVTVTRANTYGSNAGTFEVQATDVAPVVTLDTPWTKALDFSGSSEHAKMVTTLTSVSALRMGGSNAAVAPNSDTTKTSSSSSARPWATAIVFKSDLNSSYQNIWSSGEGSGNNDDNIYLRTDTNGVLYFGWGRGSANNECIVHTGISSSVWYGVYIAHKGARFSSSNATASSLAGAFDIRVMSSGDSFANLGTNRSTSANWTSTGYAMNRGVHGDLTIGGRGSNKSFHGKVASFVSTTLKLNDSMPTDAEVELMITDPIKWVTDYKVGEIARYPASTSTFTFPINNAYSGYATQVWLMGDGTSDSYSAMIRNYINPSDQNYTKLQLNSMVSNDIESVNIPGLS